MENERAELSRRLRARTTDLLDLLRNRPPRIPELARTLAEVGRISGQALEVTRTSIWLFSEAGERLTCKLLLCDGQEVAGEGICLDTAASPAYFQALRKSGVVAVEDALADPRTAELHAYLRANGVHALLDISIVVPGEVLGVVCHEHTAGLRRWQPEEIDFATHVGDLMALALEVERRQLAEAKAQGTEARYRHLVESLPVTVYSFDPFSRRLEYLSPQIQELGSFRPEDLLRDVSVWLGLVHPDDRPLVEARFAPGGVDRVPTEIVYRLLVPETGVRYVRDHCRVVRDHAGRPLAIQGVLADITAQRRAEQRTIELERRFRGLLQRIDLIALILDRHGRAEFVNEAFERCTGYAAHEVLGVDCFSLLLPASEATAVRERFRRGLARTELTRRIEHEITTRAGEKRRVLWTNMLLYAEDGTPEGTCSLGLDISERVQLEAALLQHTKIESLGGLAAGIAHDFNNILTVMTYQVERLAKATTSDSDAPDATILLEQSIAQAAELTRALLVYSRKEPISLAPVQVDNVIRALSPLLEALSRKNPQLELELDAPDAEVVMDEGQLRQLLMNLVGNGVEATRGHGKRVVLLTAVEACDEVLARRHGASRGGAFLAITVRDEGHGMDRDTISRIFEPFFTTKPRGKGTGLGLAMCQAIVRRAGGFMVVESAPGRGSVFRAYLPLRNPPGKAALPRIPTERIEQRQVSALVAVADAGVRELAARDLAELKLSVESVGDAQTAARVLASEDVGVLVTCDQLGDGSGRVLACSARAVRPHLRVLFIGADAEESPEFDAVLRKPLARGTIRDAARALLEE